MTKKGAKLRKTPKRVQDGGGGHTSAIKRENRGIQRKGQQVGVLKEGTDGGAVLFGRSNDKIEIQKEGKWPVCFDSFKVKAGGATGNPLEMDTGGEVRIGPWAKAIVKIAGMRVGVKGNITKKGVVGGNTVPTLGRLKKALGAVSGLRGRKTESQ